MKENNRNLVCPFCSDDNLNKIGPETNSLSQHNHRGTLTVLYDCSNCGFEGKKKGTGCLRATSSEPILWTQYETTPSGYMTVVNGNSGKVENSSEFTKDEIYRAIEYCQKQSDDWYIIPPKTTYEIDDDHVQEDLEEIAKSRINSDGEFFNLN